MRKNREGGWREILEKDMAKWKKNENLEEINLSDKAQRDKSMYQVHILQCDSWEMLVAPEESNP